MNKSTANCKVNCNQNDFMLAKYFLTGIFSPPPPPPPIQDIHFHMKLSFIWGVLMASHNRWLWRLSGDKIWIVFDNNRDNLIDEDVDLIKGPFGLNIIITLCPADHKGITFEITQCLQTNIPYVHFTHADQNQILNSLFCLLIFLWPVMICVPTFS